MSQRLKLKNVWILGESDLMCETGVANDFLGGFQESTRRGFKDRPF